MDYLLIGKYLSGEASEAEVQEIFQWIDADPENRDEFIQYKKAWALTAKSADNQQKEWNKLKPALAKTKDDFHILFGFLKYAASVLLILGLGMLVQYMRDQRSGEEFSYQADAQIEVPRGQMSNVVLPDGTSVHLNSGTKLVYSGQFQSGNRVVSLEGEAFFDVAKDLEHPFIIQTKSLNFKVYGTSFNVQAYPEDKEINTTLVEGSLGIVGKSGSELTRIVPGENANFSEVTRKLTVSKIDPELYTSWKDGLVTFRNEKLRDIAQKMERWYNVEIVIKNKRLGEELYMITIMKNKPIDQILQVFALTSSLNYRIVPRVDKPTLIYWE